MFNDIIRLVLHVIVICIVYWILTSFVSIPITYLGIVIGLVFAYWLWTISNSDVLWHEEFLKQTPT